MARGRSSSPSVNVAYGVVGIVAGVAFLVLNLSDPSQTDAGDWFWCVVGFVAGVFLLYRGARSRRP